jgi:hypothetical protein
LATLTGHRLGQYAGRYYYLTLAVFPAMIFLMAMIP